MKLIGEPTINPFLFVSGKLSGYVAVLALIITLLLGAKISERPLFAILGSGILLVSGLMLISVSILNLGSSISMGLPRERTNLVKAGIYAHSRNPMYLGFDLVTISSIIFCQDTYIALLGIYSIVVYHLIILGEERFLKARFGRRYRDYLRSVPRYI
jgi:protein-S-isoprenylcysteine O-methyltransferase Ste14